MVYSNCKLVRKALEFESGSKFMVRGEEGREGGREGRREGGRGRKREGGKKGWGGGWGGGKDRWTDGQRKEEREREWMVDVERNDS